MAAIPASAPIQQPAEGRAVFGTRDVHIHMDSATIKVLHEPRTPEFLESPEVADDEDEPPLGAFVPSIDESAADAAVEEAWSPTSSTRLDRRDEGAMQVPDEVDETTTASAMAGTAVAAPTASMEAPTELPGTEVSSPLANASVESERVSPAVEPEPWTPAEVEIDTDEGERYVIDSAPDLDGEQDDHPILAAGAVYEAVEVEPSADTVEQLPQDTELAPEHGAQATEQLADVAPVSELEEPWSPEAAAPVAAPSALPGEPFRPEATAPEAPSATQAGSEPEVPSAPEARAADPLGREQLAVDPLGPPPAQVASSASSGGGHDEEDLPLLPAFDMKLAEAMTPAAPAVSAPTPRSMAAQAPRPRRPINPFLANDPNQKAKRLARALISDIVTYHPDRHRQSLQSGTLKLAFSEEIKKSYEEYVAQMGKDFGDSTTHFQDALNDILAAGRRIF